MLCNSQAQQILKQSEELENSKYLIDQQDEGIQERKMELERNAERRVFEAEKSFRNQVI